jgi:hypothetical protein
LRELEPDYGLDGIVEVFTDFGNATGHMFFVQLKATDEPDITAALRVRLSQRHLEYYSTLALPVLLVLYHAATAQLYGRWIDEESPAPAEVSVNSRTVRLAEQDAWCDNRLPALLNELEDLRRAQRIGARELRIARYYASRRDIDLSEPASGPSPPAQRFKQSERLMHPVFGPGVVDQETEHSLFMRFDEDRDVFARKFLPGQTWEFIRVSQKPEGRLATG